MSLPKSFNVLSYDKSIVEITIFYAKAHKNNSATDTTICCVSIRYAKLNHHG